MKQIHITRDGKNVTFETVNIDTTDNVFFTNMDPEQPHKPSILKLGPDEQLGTYPSPNSSQVPVPEPAVKNPKPPPLYVVRYTCEIQGRAHEDEKGIINVYAPLAAVNTTVKAIKGQSTRQQLVSGGKPFYEISDLIVNNKNMPDSIGLSWTISDDFLLMQNTQGIWLTGNGKHVATYNFTFTVDDQMGRNLQQVQYKLTVTAS